MIGAVTCRFVLWRHQCQSPGTREGGGVCTPGFCSVTRLDAKAGLLQGEKNRRNNHEKRQCSH